MGVVRVRGSGAVSSAGAASCAGDTASCAISPADCEGDTASCAISPADCEGDTASCAISPADTGDARPPSGEYNRPPSGEYTPPPAASPPSGEYPPPPAAAPPSSEYRPPSGEAYSRAPELAIDLDLAPGRSSSPSGRDRDLDLGSSGDRGSPWYAACRSISPRTPPVRWLSPRKLDPPPHTEGGWGG